MEAHNETITRKELEECTSVHSYPIPTAAGFLPTSSNVEISHCTGKILHDIEYSILQAA
jgi:hypothetical protein